MGERDLTSADIGTPCTYVDPHGNSHNALITNVFGNKCCNVAYTATEPLEKDDYGQKIKRSSSVMRRDVQQAHGNYWY